MLNLRPLNLNTTNYYFPFSEFTLSTETAKTITWSVSNSRQLTFNLKKFNTQEIKIKKLFKFFFSDITAADNLNHAARFTLVYLFFNIRNSQRQMLLSNLASFIEHPSIQNSFVSATIAEREIYDLFGIFFKGNSDLRRILTDYGFRGHPLRKDFPLSGYFQLKYSSFIKGIVFEYLELVQEYRSYNFPLIWEIGGIAIIFMVMMYIFNLNYPYNKIIITKTILYTKINLIYIQKHSTKTSYKASLQFLMEQQTCLEELFNAPIITRPTLLKNMITYCNRPFAEWSASLDVFSGITKGQQNSFSYKEYYHEMLNQGMIKRNFKLDIDNHHNKAPSMFIFELFIANALAETRFFKSVTLHVKLPTNVNKSHTRQTNPDFTVILRINDDHSILMHHFDSKTGKLQCSGMSHIFAPKVNINDLTCDGILNPSLTAASYLIKVKHDITESMQNILSRDNPDQRILPYYNSIMNLQMDSIESFSELNYHNIKIMALKPDCRWNQNLIFPQIQKLATKPISDLMKTQFVDTMVTNYRDRKILYKSHANENPEINEAITSWDKNFFDQIK